MSTYRTNIITKQEKWNQLKSRLDNFSTFTWRGNRADDKFHIFIIADKPGDLKFYNGPSFSNEYSKTQFSNASGNLLGVSFNRQQISFKVGMYYFSISDWQDFIEWINPYEVNYLTFSHAPAYGYLVKLAKIEDTPRYVIGNENNEPMYYTEMTLVWDLQGDSCVRSNLPYEWEINSDGINYSFNLYNPKNQSIISKLETPLLLTIPLNITGNNLHIQFTCNNVTLFNINLNPISYNVGSIEKNSAVNMNVDDFYKQNVFLVQPTIQYDSETGILLYNAGDTSWKLLHLNMLDDAGNYVVKNMQVNKFKAQDISDLQFQLTVLGASVPNNKPLLQMYERTNVI